MKKVLTHCLLFTACFIVCTSCSKKVDKPSASTKTITLSKTSETTTTTSQTPGNCGHTCGGGSTTCGGSGNSSDGGY